MTSAPNKQRNAHDSGSPSARRPAPESRKIKKAKTHHNDSKAGRKVTPKNTASATALPAAAPPSTLATDEHDVQDIAVADITCEVELQLLRIEHDATQTELKTYKEENRKLSLRCVQAERRARDAERRVTEVELKVSEATRKVSVAERKVTEAERRVTEADRRVTEIQHQVAEERHEVSEAERMVSEADRHATEAECRAIEAESKVGIAERKASTAELKHGAAERDVVVAREQAASAERRAERFWDLKMQAEDAARETEIQAHQEIAEAGMRAESEIAEARIRARREVADAEERARNAEERARIAEEFKEEAERHAAQGETRRARAQKLLDTCKLVLAENVYPPELQDREGCNSTRDKTAIHARSPHSNRSTTSSRSGDVKPGTT